MNISITTRHGNFNVPHINYKKQKGYKSPKGNAKIGIAAIYLRTKYKMSMNKISQILGVSTRTVHRKISFHRLIKGSAFDCSKIGRKRREVKIVNTKGQILGLKALIWRIALYISGFKNTIIEALGDEPP